MTSKSESETQDKPRQTPDDSEVIWGARAIGAVINRNPRQTFYLLENKQLAAKKIGGIWASTRKKLRDGIAS
jgi:hypothetical protein